MAGRKFKKFNGYKPQIKREREPIKVPKAYLVNGSYIIGEPLAMLCKEQGMKVKEVKCY